MSRSVFTEFLFRLSGIIFPIFGKTIIRYIDGTAGTSLIIERPVVFSKVVVSSNIEPQLPHQQLLQDEETMPVGYSCQNENAVSAVAVAAEDEQQNVTRMATGLDAHNRLVTFSIDGKTYEALEDDELERPPEEDDLPF